MGRSLSTPETVPLAEEIYINPNKPQCMKRQFLGLHAVFVLMEKGQLLTTAELFRELVKRGVLKNSKADKKSLTRTLSKLESAGFVCSTGGVGRRGKRWELKLTYPNLKGSNSLREKL
ncbi:hypothetical protein Theam_1674 [Thermovibrio ammonificans HB-1]|uniref:Uncharacterized protein n=2 Tax=Thermovibrio ammonificans TaxID=228745 RepID=E8T5H6_THEA1|nr:hypothetical protein Theam_1674 [Thermovibrio ammonificans HB-1]